MRGTPPRRRVFALAVLAAAGLACGGPGTNPSETDARAALEAALSGWKAGKKPADLATAASPVHVVDSEWANGRKLADFQILRDVPSQTDKRFAVKLVHDQPPKEAEVVYIVVGAETKTVFRSEDYERTMNMDNNPRPARKAAGGMR